MSVTMRLLVAMILCLSHVTTSGGQPTSAYSMCKDARDEERHGTIISQLTQIENDVRSLRDRAGPPDTGAPDAFPGRGCPVDRGMFATFQNHTYLLGLDKLTWHVARARCLQCGYTLARVESLTEQVFIRTWFGEAGIGAISAPPIATRIVWMDGTDEGHEGCWVWTHPEIIPISATYTGWGATEPGGGTVEQCLSMNGWDNWNWVDYHCLVPRLYLCKRPGGMRVNYAPPLEDAYIPEACPS